MFIDLNLICLLKIYKANISTTLDLLTYTCAARVPTIDLRINPKNQPNVVNIIQTKWQALNPQDSVNYHNFTIYNQVAAFLFCTFFCTPLNGLDVQSFSNLMESVF